jgi:hypothetical protein
LTRFCHLSRDRRSWAGCIRSSALAGVSTVGLSIGLVEVILCLAVLAGVCDGYHHRMLQHRRGGEAKVTQSGKRIENWPLNCNSISLALGAVSFKRGTCARSRSGASADVCARQPIYFRIPRARADAESARNQTKKRYFRQFD